MFNVKDYIWAAGFLEGEGYFGSAGRKRTATAITVAQKDPECLHRLRQIFDGGSVAKYWHKNKYSHYWVYSLGGLRAVEVMMTLYTLMSSRRKQQISESLVKWKAIARRSYNRIPGCCPQGHKMTEENSYWWFSKRQNKSYPSCRICRKNHNDRWNKKAAEKHKQKNLEGVVDGEK